MQDKMYARLDPAMMGFRYLGVLESEPQRLIYDALTSLRASMGPTWKAQLEEKEVFWLNVWQQGLELGEDLPAELESSLVEALHAWCRGAVERYCEPEAIMDVLRSS